MIFNKPAQGGDDVFSDVFISSQPADQSIFSAMKRSPHVAPLYLNSNENIGVVFERTATEQVLVVDSIPEHAVMGTAGFAGQFAPLFILESEDGRRANFDIKKLQQLFSEVELDITVVEPLAFLVIELGAALAAVGEVEVVDHLIEGHQFDVVAGVPPEQRKEVDHGLRQVATLAIAR